METKFNAMFDNAPPHIVVRKIPHSLGNADKNRSNLDALKQSPKPSTRHKHHQYSVDCSAPVAAAQQLAHIPLVTSLPNAQPSVRILPTNIDDVEKRMQQRQTMTSTGNRVEDVFEQEYQKVQIQYTIKKTEKKETTDQFDF